MGTDPRGCSQKATDEIEILPTPEQGAQRQRQRFRQLQRRHAQERFDLLDRWQARRRHGTDAPGGPARPPTTSCCSTRDTIARPPLWAVGGPRFDAGLVTIPLAGTSCHTPAPRIGPGAGWADPKEDLRPNPRRTTWSPHRHQGGPSDRHPV